MSKFRNGENGKLGGTLIFLLFFVLKNDGDNGQAM
jgi:hypothetical protein